MPGAITATACNAFIEQHSAIVARHKEEERQRIGERRRETEKVFGMFPQVNSPTKLERDCADGRLCIVLVVEVRKLQLSGAPSLRVMCHPALLTSPSCHIFLQSLAQRRQLAKALARRLHAHAEQLTFMWTLWDSVLAGAARMHCEGGGVVTPKTEALLLVRKATAGSTRGVSAPHPVWCVMHKVLIAHKAMPACAH